MACYNPIKAYVSYERRTKNGKSQIQFSRKDAGFSRPVDLPCGQCIGCRIQRSKDWALRCIHEASIYESNCFITLTFNKGTMNNTGTLVKSDFQKFMKRLRKRFRGFSPVVRNLATNNRASTADNCIPSHMSPSFLRNGQLDPERYISA